MRSPRSRRGGRGSPAVGVLRVKVGAKLDEERDRLGVAVGSRGHQWRTPIPVQRHTKAMGGGTGHTTLDAAMPGRERGRKKGWGGPQRKGPTKTYLRLNREPLARQCSQHFSGEAKLGKVGWEWRTDLVC